MAQELSAARNFGASLALFQQMLPRAQEDVVRFKVLYGIAACSIWLNLDKITESVICELKELPDYEISDAFLAMTQAKAYVDQGRAHEALCLIEMNLRNDVLQRNDFGDWKYEHLFLKGHCLVHLARYTEALLALDAAHEMEPTGLFETNILIERANCYFALDQNDDAYATASQVLEGGDEELATLAMQYMAEARLAQGCTEESLRLYRDLQNRLPRRLIDGKRIEQGVRNALAYLEKRNPQEKLF